MEIEKLPKEFKCDAALLAAYGKLEKSMLPYLKKKSHILSSAIPTIDFDDALQEGRSAVIVALAYVDSSKGNGNVGPYVWKVVKNAYCGMASEAILKSRIPHIDGKPCFPISLDTMLETDGGGHRSYEVPDAESLTPEEKITHQKMRTEVGKFTMKMYNRLTGIDYDVFKCKVHPTSDFLDMLYLDGEDFVYRDEQGVLVLSDGFDISAEQIGRYLGINKNAVGWSLYKIRKLFLEMARYDSDFIGLFSDMVIDKRWPMVHVKKGDKEDLEFKREIFAKRCLCSKQIAPSEYAVSKKKDSHGLPYYSRLIKWYDWGASVTVKRASKYYTVIVEGRFNAASGAVFGEGIKHAQEHIPMKWYRAMVKELVDA